MKLCFYDKFIGFQGENLCRYGEPGIGKIRLKAVQFSDSCIIHL